MHSATRIAQYEATFVRVARQLEVRAEVTEIAYAICFEASYDPASTELQKLNHGLSFPVVPRHVSLASDGY